MNKLLKLEHVGLSALAIYLFTTLGFEWWWYPVLLLTPDIGMLGYLGGTRLGAVTYNFTHHLTVAAGLFILGGITQLSWLQLAGVIVLGHSSGDRLLGYGLKYNDSFQHTHLGRIDML